MKILQPLLRKLGYVPASRQISKRTFSAAATNRLTNDWRANGISVDAALSGENPMLRARARDLAKNDKYFGKFLTMLKCNVIGEHTMTLKNKAAEPLTFSNGEIKQGALDVLANKLIEDAWFEWGKKNTCTITKDMTFHQVEHLVVEELGTVGETLWEMMLGAEAENEFGFALKPIKIERLDSSANHQLANGNIVRNGREKNKNGKVVAYWILDGDPTDTFQFRGSSAFTSRRYPAEKFVRVFLRREIGQTAGYPWAAASMLAIKMLDGYSEAVVDGSRAAACKMGFLTKTGDGAGYTGEDAPGGGKYMDAEPGLLEELPLGMDIKTIDWNMPGDQFDPFVKSCLRGIASGLNVSYPNLANDYGEVNFSAGRMARMEETEFWKMIQSAIITDFHEEVFARWLEYSLLNQAITYPGSAKPLPASKYKKFNAPNFTGRRWGWVDPTKEVAALSEGLRLQITSHTRICAELGIDRDELFAEIAEDKAAAAQHGITLPDESALAEAKVKMDAAAKMQSTQATQDTEDDTPSKNGNRLALNGHGH